MTGATGDLTPDEIQDDLVTAERREIEDPATQAAVTQTQAGSPPEGEPTPPEPEAADEPAPQSEPRIGGDEVSEEEHF